MLSYDGKHGKHHACLTSGRCINILNLACRHQQLANKVANVAVLHFLFSLAVSNALFCFCVAGTVLPLATYRKSSDGFLPQHLITNNKAAHPDIFV